MVRYITTAIHKREGKQKWVGQKKPFTPEQVRLIRELIKSNGNLRDLVLFCCAIDTLLRAIDLISLTVSDVMTPYGLIREEFPLQQKKHKQQFL